MAHGELDDIFGGFDPAAHEAEAAARWGGTAAYREAARRTKRYTKDDWVRFGAERDAVNAELAARLDEGAAPDDPRAIAAAENHRRLIDTWFYPCPPGIHAQLGELYVADPRFTATYESVCPGLARYLRDAAAAALAPPER